MQHLFPFCCLFYIVFIAVKLLNGFLTLASLFERSVFRSDSLKQKVTVGKDTLNIKKAVCCSEVGDVETTANCAQGHHPNEMITVQAFVPNNTSSVGLTGISISLFSVVQLLTVALSNTLLIQWSSDTFLRTFEQMRLEVIISTMPGNTITLKALFVADLLNSLAVCQVFVESSWTCVTS